MLRLTDKTATLTPAISERKADRSPKRSELLASQTNSFCRGNYAPIPIKPAYRLKLFILCLSLFDYISLASRFIQIDMQTASLNVISFFFNFFIFSDVIFAVEFVSDVHC